MGRKVVKKDPDTEYAKRLHLSLNGLRTHRQRGIDKPKVGADAQKKKNPAPKKQISKLQQRKLYLKELMLHNKDEYLKQFAYLYQLRSLHHATGQRLFVKVKGIGYWPAVLWELGLCPRSTQKVLFESYVEGSCVARLYGDNSVNWFPTQDVHIVYDNDEYKPEGSLNMKKLKHWARSKGKHKLYDNLLSSLEKSSPNPHIEKARLVEQQRTHFDARTDKDTCCAQCGEPVEENKIKLICGRCERRFHDVCIQPPMFLDEDDENATIPSWTCPFCSFKNDKAGDETFVKMGLTPDWLIEEAAFNVFKLKPPTSEEPYIKGLLDPCTNSKQTPNIPAEVLYDKKDDGLKIENSWKGYYVILNPEYKASIQWRFINRAIDEVENGHCPTIILVCRNSTDTAYFHRLLPYPRILLRRNSIHFKDYQNTPIGFGIVVFCIAMNNCPVYYKRFYDAFSQYGEINIPVDSEVFQQDLFHKLIARLKIKAAGTQRDHWALCEKCGTWRSVPYSTILKINADPESTWTCSDLTDGRGPQGCAAPLSNFEIEGQSWDMYRRVKDIEKDRSKKEKSKNHHANHAEKDASEEEEEKDDTETAVESGLKHVIPWKKLRINHTMCSVKGKQDGGKLRSVDDLGLNTSQLTPLELARVTRIAKNKNVLKKLGIKPKTYKAPRKVKPAEAGERMKEDSAVVSKQIVPVPYGIPSVHPAAGNRVMNQEPVMAIPSSYYFHQGRVTPCSRMQPYNHFHPQGLMHMHPHQHPPYLNEVLPQDDPETKKVAEELLAIRDKIFEISREYQKKASEYNVCLTKLMNRRKS